MVQAPRQQNRGEEPSLTQRSLLSPALSVEAWDPAITSAWVRLLPLPGSAPSTLPGSTCQGPSWSSRPFEGTPTTLAWTSHLHSPLVPTAQKGYRSPCPAWVQFTNRLPQGLALASLVCPLLSRPLSPAGIGALHTPGK